MLWCKSVCANGLLIYSTFEFTLDCALDGLWLCSVSEAQTLIKTSSEEKVSSLDMKKEFKIEQI